jgi:hypothetical protein
MILTFFIYHECRLFLMNMDIYILFYFLLIIILCIYFYFLHQPIIFYSNKTIHQNIGPKFIFFL